MRILLFDCLQPETEKIKSLISAEGFETVNSSTEDVGEHLYFGQFDVIVVSSSIDKDFKQKVFELAKNKNTKVIEFKKDETEVEKYVREVVLPEIKKVDKNEFTGKTRINL